MEENIKIVIDTSVVLAKIMPDEIEGKDVDEIFLKHAKNEVLFIAPKILPFEVANALKSACKSKRLDSKLAFELYQNFVGLKVEYKDIDLSKTINLALNENLSIYDAVYLQLGIENKCKLLTLDKQLKVVFDKITL